MKLEHKRGRKPTPKTLLNSQKVKALVNHECKVYARGTSLFIQIDYGRGMTKDDIITTDTYIKLTNPTRSRGRPRTKPLPQPTKSRKRGRPAGSFAQKKLRTSWKDFL